MFGIGPTELAFFLVILLLAVGPDRLPTFMRTVGKGVRQVRNASREFKDAIGLDELMREGDPFRAPPVRPPQARPVPAEKQLEEPAAESTEPGVDSPKPAAQPSQAATVPPPPPPAALTAEPEPTAEGDAPTEAKRS
ncbi:MAG: Sec-independent protein translocase subunit TatA/TatB [Polyangiales bacterium]